MQMPHKNLFILRDSITDEYYLLLMDESFRTLDALTRIKVQRNSDDFFKVRDEVFEAFEMKELNATEYYI
jgi:ABC-type nitrate/sulfonate/bicarbonate transport system ATPase subunit